MARPRFRCVVFDFDGVLVDSNALKRDAYFTIFRSVPGSAHVVDDTLRHPIDGDRHDTIRSILEGLVRAGTLRPEDAGEGAIATFANRYNDICEEAVRRAPEMEHSTWVLQQLASVCSLYINSATPEEPLRRIVSGRNLAPYFKDVFGRPATKIENLRKIIDRERVRPEEMVFVGDGANDYEAAQTCGCTFIAFVNGSAQFGAEVTTRIAALSQLTELVLQPH
jgi:phosphoglycolate phosphatase-like HAD superfamily hydrolase